MSEKDRFEWNDDTEFDSGTDQGDAYEDFQDPLDGFADYDEMSGFDDNSEEDLPAVDASEASDRDELEAAAAVREGLAEKIPANPKAAEALKKQKRRRGISALGMGVLFTASILVAGIGVGGAILLAEGVHPASLWQPKNLLQVDQLLNFADHPLNILYMVAMGVAFLALLGSFKMARVAAEANVRTREAEEMLDRVTALSLDRQEEWQSQEFKEFPPAEAFVIRTLGAWRLQEARQKRLMGVEGELHRLEKALNKNSRADLTGRFDHPAVGRLSDEMLRYFDARDVAVQKLEDYEKRDRTDGKEMLETLQESRIWNGATLDKLSLQGNALEDLAREMEDLVVQVEKTTAAAGSTDRLTDIIEGVRRDLDRTNTAAGVSEKTITDLNELVDRGSKLAFQIAMEVARLGPRGERLLPMSQSLEDLTTGFRQLADRVNDQDNQGVAAPGLGSVHKKLETLAVLVTEDVQAPWQDLVDEVQDYSPAAARVSATLIRMVDEFNEQEDRLVRVGASLGNMTGAEFDSSSIPRKESSDAPVSPLEFNRPEKRQGPLSPASGTSEVDPFATASSSVLAGDDGPSDPDFSSSILPNNPAASLDSASDPEPMSLDMQDAGHFDLGGDAAEDMPLSGDEEKVYDLEDFGASSVEEPESESREEVYDLSAFGASPMDSPVEPEPEEEVFELSAFGASPLDNPVEPEAEEEVFELSDFGASAVDVPDEECTEDVYDLAELGALPLDDGLDTGSGDPAAEEPVFDLSDFGAKPMN